MSPVMPLLSFRSSSAIHSLLSMNRLLISKNTSTKSLVQR